MATAKQGEVTPKKKRRGNKENLVSLADRSTEEQRKIAAMGGKKSGEVRREKKLMSAIYAEFLAKKHRVKLLDESEIEIDGSELMEIVSRNILERGDSASVSLMKEMREATEGSTFYLGEAEVSNMSPEERKKRIAELEKELHSDKP